MPCLSKSIAQSDPFLQELFDKKCTLAGVADLGWAALGRVVAVKVAQEVLNERGQTPTKGYKS
jgi:hypothetical protein